jgi:cell division septal protein FtsQ
MVFIDKNDIKTFITSHQPNIQDVEIRKIYPSNIKITLSSYKELYNINVE